MRFHDGASALIHDKDCMQAQVQVLRQSAIRSESSTNSKSKKDAKYKAYDPDGDFSFDGRLWHGNQRTGSSRLENRCRRRRS